MRDTLQAPMPNNLPRPLTSFVGRAHDIRVVAQALASTRLLTLVGVGGSGKTRLAAEVAHAALDAYPGGVWWVDLAPLTEGALVLQALAKACHVTEQPGKELLEILIERLAPESSLVILDNCEHLIESCAEVAQTLLSLCPSLTMLATSREILNIAGETVFPTPTLNLPDQDHAADDLDAIGQSDAVRLFVERANAAAPTFTLSHDSAPAVVNICRRIDGLPLAIELAAARVRVLSLDEIAQRLTSATLLLTGGSRTAAPRQQTLRATLEWSYTLLPAAEALLFQRLSVFVGGFTLEAAEAVGGGDGIAPADVLDLLTHLVDKSLVTLEHERSRSPAVGGRRYRLLEVLRQYGAEKLEAADQSVAAHTRHYDYFLSVAERAEPGLEGPTQLQWLNRLDLEHDNIRAAMQWRLDRGEGEDAARLAAHLWRFWLVRGYLSEGARWLQQALNSFTERNVVRARVLYALSVLVLHHTGPSDATPLAEETLALSRALDDAYGIATALLCNGIIAHSRGEYAQAIAFLEESLPRCTQIGYGHGASLSMSSLGFAALHLGDYARAQALCAESVAFDRQLGDLRSLGGSLTNLGVALLARGEHVEALAHFEESLAIRRELGDVGGIAHALLFLGRAALEHERTEQAQAYFRESYALRDTLGDQVGQVVALEGLAAVAAAQGEGALAARRFGAAEAVRDHYALAVEALDQPFRERWIAATRELLSREDFAARWSAGRALTPREAAAAPSATPTAAAVEAARPAPAAEPAARDGSAAPARPAPELRIYALGPARVFLHKRLLAPTDWTYAKARELLYFLLARPSATKQQIGLALWPDASEAQVRSQLHPILHALRRALGGQEWIIFERGRYRFNRERGYSYDVAAFEAAFAQARRTTPADPERAIALLETATQLYRGDFLADAGRTTGAEGEWIDAYRGELRQQWLDALDLLGASYLAQGDATHAAAVYRRLISADPFQEHAHRELMRCLAQMGERAQALRHFESLTRLLNDELDTTPAPETVALADTLRHGRAP